jgi:uncharacterized delta-60 repeat protein
MNKSPPPNSKNHYITLKLCRMKHFIYLLLALLSYSTASQAQFQEGLDPYFGNKGIVGIDDTKIDPIGFENGLIQPDGKIVVAALHHVSRFNPDGSIDNSFGVGGTFYQPIMFYYKGFYYPYSLYNINRKVILQPDGKIICVGYGWYPAPFDYAILLRLLPDGTLDPSFGEGGIVSDSSSRENNDWTSALLMPDGKILLVANTDTASTRDFTVFTRYKSNGVRDSTFGIDGFVTSPQRESLMGDVELQPDGKILVLSDVFSVARYHPNGRPDSSFHFDGFNKIFSGSIAPFSKAMAVRPDGKIWVAGYVLFSSPTLFILARFNADGSIDSTFNEVGYKDYATDTGSENKLRDMILLPDGKVVLGGKIMNRATKQYNFGLMRIHPDGREDSTFGINGRLLTQMNLAATEGGADLLNLLLQNDGKLVALGEHGFRGSSTGYFSTVVRYYGNGKTNIFENSDNQKFTVFPIPAKDMVNILFPNTARIEYLSLSNINGQVVKTFSKAPISNTIDVSNLSNGVYFISITIDGITSHQKIIIQH